MYYLLQLIKAGLWKWAPPLITINQGRPEHHTCQPIGYKTFVRTQHSSSISKRAGNKAPLRTSYGAAVQCLRLRAQWDQTHCVG